MDRFWYRVRFTKRQSRAVPPASRSAVVVARLALPPGRAFNQRDGEMRNIREAELPPGPAKLTDVAVRGKGPARPAARKSGDLTSDVIEIVEQQSLPRQREITTRAHMPSSSTI